MQTASLPRNFSANKASNTQKYSFEWPGLNSSDKSLTKASMILADNVNATKSQGNNVEEAPSDDTSTSPAASLFMRYVDV